MPHSTVPDTKARRKLATWIALGKSQSALARATGIPQQTLSAYLLRIARPPALRAELIEAATRGAVPASDWHTNEERAAVRRTVRRVA